MSGAINHRLVQLNMRGTEAKHMIRRRDAAGREMEMLAKLANDPKPDPKVVHRYMREMLSKDHIPSDKAHAILAAMPHDPAGLRAWARQAFAFVMHQGIHAHAAFPKLLFPSPSEDVSSPEPEEGNNEVQD